uniref:Metal-dependent carboxypeptidase n=1 Tax=Candidatus Methanomethylicus mesodigestus TaxID=1867258 RepID=A0A7C3IXP8_9CREN
MLEQVGSNSGGSMQSSVPDDYKRLMDKFKDLTVLQSAAAIIQWDMETKMPPAAYGLRSEQLALLSQIDHRMSTDPEIGPLLARLGGIEGLDSLAKRNVYLIKKMYDEKTKIPESLVKELAKQEVVAYSAWKSAKSKKDFSLFRPELEKIFELKMRVGEILMGVKGTRTVYDALLDIFEPKMTADSIAVTFEGLRNGLKSVISKYSGRATGADIALLKRKVPIDAQREISKALARFIGYDIEGPNAKGRIDETEHPFTTGYYDDVRITTHYYEEDCLSSLMSVLHEGGHAMYETSLPREWMYQPIGSACSYGFHESQSRFVENVVGRSPEFWGYFFPEFNRATGGAFSDAGADALVRAVNIVRPSKIRIEADEATYAMHIIIRFEIEQALFGGKISVAELPQVWNQKYRDYLGVEVENDAEGVLQDVHWSHGYFGYFPSYALGNIYAGMMIPKIDRDVPGWRDAIRRGSFSEVREWLRRNVHNHGNLYDPPDLLRKAAGGEVTPAPFLSYLDAKYSRVYGL